MYWMKSQFLDKGFAFYFGFITKPKNKTFF